MSLPHPGTDPQSSPDSAVEMVGGADFHDHLLASPLPVLVSFWAPWCPPSLQMRAVVDELAREFRGRARLASLDVETHPGQARDSGVTALPTFVLYENGRESARLVGARPKGDLRTLLVHSQDAPVHR